MKLSLTLAFTLLVTAKHAQAQCDFTFCGGATNMQSQTTVINPDAPAAEQTTCQDVFDSISLGVAAGIQLSAEECAGLKIFENFCCPSQTTRECFICGSADATINAQKELAGGMVKCGEIDAALAILPAGQLCDQTKQEIGLDLAAFCECPGAATPKGCQVCDDDQEVNATAIVPGQEGTSLTCSQGFEYAKYVNNDQLCTQEIATAETKAACCMAKVSTSGISTPSSISSLATALIVGLAAFIV